MKVAIVIPAHNEGSHIKSVIKGIRKHKEKTSIIVVDDGSSDNTPEVLRKLQLSISNFQILRHRVNLGKGAAMTTGALYAFNNNVDAVIFMDADGQHSAKDLNKFINKLKEGHDIVLGVRKKAKDIPFVRGFGNKVGIAVVYLLFGIKVSDLLCGYRAVTKKAFKKLNLISTGYGIETEMAAKMAVYDLSFTQVVVKTIYHDKHKGVTILHAFAILIDVIRWRISL